MGNVLIICCVLHAPFVSSEGVQLIGEKVPGSGDWSACAISADGKTVVIGTPYYDGVNGWTAVVYKFMLMMKVIGIN